MSWFVRNCYEMFLLRSVWKHSRKHLAMRLARSGSAQAALLADATRKFPTVPEGEIGHAWTADGCEGNRIYRSAGQRHCLPRRPGSVQLMKWHSSSPAQRSSGRRGNVPGASAGMTTRKSPVSGLEDSAFPGAPHGLSGAWGAGLPWARDRPASCAIRGSQPA